MNSKRRYVTCLFLLSVATMMVMYSMQVPRSTPSSSDVGQRSRLSHSDDSSVGHAGVTWRRLSHKQVSSLSELGRMMFVDESIDNAPSGQLVNTQHKTYEILVWKFGEMLERRFMRRYGKQSFDPFSECSVRCDLTYDAAHVTRADAVLVHLHRTAGLASLPASRNVTSRWVYLADESPYNTFMDHAQYNAGHNYDGVFNWSMTYRMDSDVPVPYGRTLRLTARERENAPLDVDYAGNKTKMAAIMGSNCGGNNDRWRWVKELQQHMTIDVYGGCGTLKCPGHYDLDCPLLNAYKFYLSFENGNCREYITEKAWFNAYHHGAVPIIMGASLADVARLLPPHSYIHIEQFDSPQQLAELLVAVDANNTRYNEYHEWRREFKVINEHGFFGTPVYHYCRLCQALHYNSRDEKVIQHFESLRSIQQDCYITRWKL